ncbi:ABC transporter substrate-binding protein [Endozoicomonas sp. SCSIO W0465]|uniref:substrate-binding periplasmic protein n=1 Tax=Endozoicomonas sp. SCSIO W0465 TaxID=2918516 RepID=UPI002075259E|nr:ABC transporter substrate-binding protein [Endozoicomonas sp. SCSIO W0465]USE38902.1 transporter substrate-binding domain-containing protein [Endozoicomonas sp. SCSIO W0465]
MVAFTYHQQAITDRTRFLAVGIAMKFRCIPFLFLLFFSLTGNAQTSSFHLLTENFPPLNMTNNGTSYARNDRVSGFATDIMRKLFAATGYEVDFTLMSDWDEAYNSAKGTSGFGIYSTFRTPERENSFQWVGPLYEEDWVILAPQDSEVTINSLDDLRQFQVGSYEFDAITDHLIESSIDVVPAKSDAINVVKLKLGQIKLWASSSLTGPYTASNFNIPVKPIHTFSESSLWLAMHKDTDPAIVRQLNSELKRMHQSGEIQQMINSYNHL